jgi:hypothetical protein
MDTIDSDEFIYILKLEHNKHYVGKTKHPDAQCTQKSE